MTASRKSRGEERRTLLSGGGAWGGQVAGAPPSKTSKVPQAGSARWRTVEEVRPEKKPRGAVARWRQPLDATGKPTTWTPSRSASGRPHIKFNVEPTSARGVHWPLGLGAAGRQRERVSLRGVAVGTGSRGARLNLDDDREKRQQKGKHERYYP